jgi:spermidine synthase
VGREGIRGAVGEAKILSIQGLARPKCTFVMGRDEPVGAPRALLNLTAFAAGFAVTGIEIALGRLLAPHFGASLTVWASVIAAVVAALAIGYPLGGILADRRPGATLPVTASLLGGLAGAALGLMAPLVLSNWMGGVGLSGSAYWLRLGLTLLAFGIPCALLATVPPAVLRATLRQRETAGTDAGRLYALGSIGSVLGVLLPALWWIPLLGVRATFLLLAGVATAPMVVALATRVVRPSLRPTAAAVLLVGATALVPASIESRAAGDGVLLFDQDSGMQRVRVVARDVTGRKRRWLHLDEGWTAHSIYFAPEIVTGAIWDTMALTPLLPTPDDGRTDVLIIGLAGGTVSNIMTRHVAGLVPELSIVGVEIDATVVDAADRHLGLDRSRLEVAIADGRLWLRASERRFDVIVLDAYHQPSIPAHLATLEFFESVREHLSPAGVAVLNVFAPGESSRLLDGLRASWQAVFPESAMWTGQAEAGFASRLLFGGPALPLDFGRILPSDVARPLQGTWAALRKQTYRLDDTPEVEPWTDDRAPVELLTDQVYRARRPANAG